MIGKIFDMDVGMVVDYSEMLLPGALEQKTESWGFLAQHDINFVVADLWPEKRRK